MVIALLQLQNHRESHQPSQEDHINVHTLRLHKYVDAKTILPPVILQKEKQKDVPWREKEIKLTSEQ